MTQEHLRETGDENAEAVLADDAPPDAYGAVREQFSFPFELRPLQIQELNNLCWFDRAGYYWEPGCVDSETEYLTPTGWRKISGYVAGEVAQYEPGSGSISFTEPLAYIKEPCNYMVRVLGPGVDQLLSPEHKVLLYLEGGRYSTCSALGLVLKDSHNLLPVGATGAQRVPLGACEIFKASATDGFKYCFSVPSGFLLLRRNGCIFATGNCGKTAGSTHQALYWRLKYNVRQWVVLMPPILLSQWALWLRSVTNLHTGKPLSATVYAGTPAQRQKLDLNADFILLSYGLLKNDFERLHEHFEDKALGIIADEATAAKNTESQTHKAVALLAEQRPLLLLTGTPLNKPGDAYAYIRLIAPGLYRNKRMFDRLHIEEEDDYGNPKSWQNLELLASNMQVHSSRMLLREARKDMKEPQYTPRPYELDPAHLKLYRRIAEERLVEFADGSEIDAISASALRSALQQVVINWGEFDENPDRRPAVLDMIEEVLEEIGDRKLVVAAHFKRTNRYLSGALSAYNAVAVYGEISPRDKQRAIDRFISDPSCRVILLQPSSAGFGVDGLQHVCCDMLVVEAPTTPTPFQQVVARLDRDGQNAGVHVRVAIALGTVQVGMFKSLLANDELVNKVQRSYKDLRDSLYGS